MPYDLFISYSRKDNTDGRITQLVERIKSDFEAFANRPLELFFDISIEDGIKGMEDWRLKILKGLRESRMLVACLSPSYLKSEYCEWEFNEYVKHEISRAFFGDGIAPIYFVEVPGWTDNDFEHNRTDWIAELHHRQHFDFRPWFHTGEECLREVAVKERMRQLSTQLKERITKGERAEHCLGNIDANNPHFTGRSSEMRRLRTQFVEPGAIGVLTTIHGLGGVGKTALAIQYAHVFANEYGGGRWLVRCEGKVELQEAISELAAPLAIKFNNEEIKDITQKFQRVIAELRRLVDLHEPHRCLLVLDNVDNPVLIEPSKTQVLPSEDWLHVIVTTRLGETDLFGTHKNRAFLPVDELLESDALELIQSYQPEGLFQNDSEQNAAQEIVNLLGRYTLAIETAAVYLGQFAFDVKCSDFLVRLKKEGVVGLDNASIESTEGILHGEKSLVATLRPTFERLSEEEKLVLFYSSLLPADNIPLPWIRILIAKKFPNLGRDSEPGYPDPWLKLLRRLIGFRLLQVTNQKDNSGLPVIVKMHRIVQQLVSSFFSDNELKTKDAIFELSVLLLQRSIEICNNQVNNQLFWELESLYKSSQIWLINNRLYSQNSAVYCCSALRNYGYYRFALELAELVLKQFSNGKSDSSISFIWFHNLAGIAALYLGDSYLAESHFLKAQDLLNIQETDSFDKLDVLTNIGCVYRETFRPELALNPSKQALQLAEKLYTQNAPEVGIRCANLGLVLQDLCMLEEAIPLFQRAVNIHMNNKEFVLSACQDLSTLAEALRNQGLIAEAEINANRAYTLANDFGYNQHPIYISVLNNLAGIYEERGHYEEARSLYKSALEVAIFCYGSSSRQLSLCYNNLGVNSIYRGNNEIALEEIQNSFDLEFQQNKPNYQKLAHRELNIAIIYLLINNYEESLLHINSGWNYKSKIALNDLLAARLLLVRLSLSFFLEENFDIFIGQLCTLLDKDILPASGINLKWSFDNILKLSLKNCSPEQINKWNLFCNSLNSKSLQESNINMTTFVNIPRRKINEEWQNSI